MGEFDDIIPEYIAESSELLETVESGFLRLEEGEAEDETVHTVFRAIHSIKGGAGFVGLAKIERLAHKMEDLLNLVRNHDLEPTPAVTDSLIQSLDVLKTLFERVDEHAAIDIEGSLRALATALEAGLGEPVKSAVQTKGTPTPESGLPGFEVSGYDLEKKLKQGNLFHITVDMAEVEKRGLTPMQLVDEMLSMGEIVDSKVDLAPTGDPETYEVSHVCFQVLYATVLESDLVEAALRVDKDHIRTLGHDDFAMEAGPSAPAPPPRIAPVPTLETASAPRRQEAVPAPAASVRTAAATPPPVVAATEKTSRAGEYLVFELGRETYGVDILRVQEIIGMPEITRLPRSPRYMLGVMNLRGMVVPVFDLRIKLGLDTDQAVEPVVVVLNVDEKFMGAVVDGVSDVSEFSDAQIQDAPEFAGAVRREFLRGLCRHQDELIILLELDRLLAPETLGNAA